jgi:translation initiation factor IF-2
MTNERGERMKKAEPSIPVEILGLNDVPEAGDILDVVDEKTARSVAEKRLEKKRTSELHQNQKVTLDDLFNQIQQGELKELSLIVKGDVQGSVEALSQSLEGIKSEEVRITIVHAGVGAITESDVMLASASNALIIGFNVRPDAAARKMAEHEHVDLRTYRVIYDAINDVEAAMKGMLDKKFEEKVLGRAAVRKVITTPKVIVAGSYVTEGKITNSAKIRLVRNGIVVHEGEVDSLRRFKDDVKEVPEGYECGITLEGYRDIKEGDEMEAYIMVEVAPE